MNAKTAAGISAVVLALTIGLVSASAMSNGDETGEAGNAFFAKFKNRTHQMMENREPEKMQAVKEALENNDYDAWKEAVGNCEVGDCKMGEQITEENFEQFVKMHELMQNGDMEGAKAIAQELGLPANMGMAPFKGKFGQRFDPEKRDAVKAALDAGDYKAWLEAVGEDSPMAEKINEGNFDRFLEMHSLQEKARAIAEELGLVMQK